MKKLITAKEYHSLPDVGATILKKIALKSLLHAVTEEQKETPAIILGSAIHSAVLEPERFDRDFVVSEKFDRRTKAGKEVALAFETSNEGKTILEPDQMEIVRGARESIKRHEIANGMLTGGESEYSYFAEIDGVKCKCRPDYFVASALMDLKTCRDASRDGFIKACIDLGYHIQAAFYRDVFNKATGLKVDEFYFVAVETSKPYAVNTFKMGEPELALGREQYRAALAKWREFQESTDRLLDMGYEKTINEIQFPTWALSKFSA